MECGRPILLFSPKNRHEHVGVEWSVCWPGLQCNHVEMSSRCTKHVVLGNPKCPSYYDHGNRSENKTSYTNGERPLHVAAELRCIESRVISQIGFGELKAAQSCTWRGFNGAIISTNSSPSSLLCLMFAPSWAKNVCYPAQRPPSFGRSRASVIFSGTLL